MRLTNVAHLRLPFGRLVGYDLQVGEPGPALPVSFDQRRHVGGGDRAGSWMALSFRLTGQRELADEVQPAPPKSSRAHKSEYDELGPLVGASPRLTRATVNRRKLEESPAKHKPYVW